MLLLRFKVSVNLSTVNQSLLSLEFVDLHFKHSMCFFFKGI